MILYSDWATNTAPRTFAYCACINIFKEQSFPHMAYRTSQAHNHEHLIFRICSSHYDSDSMVGGNVIFEVIVLGIRSLRLVWSCANSFSASLSHYIVLGVWPDKGLNDCTQVLTQGKFVVVVFTMEFAN